MLDADLRLVRGTLRLDVALQVAAGEVLTLLGPNGAGKSTVLACLAGLLPVDAGHVRLGDDVLDDATTGRFVAPQARGVGVVFQDYLLFPHLSAVDNVAFGLRSAGRPRRQARREATAWLERMDLADVSRARPRALSGGQAQRVALARALAPGPRLLLLDEPLAALDAGARALVRAGLRSHLRAFEGCTVLVTHDPLDAMVLADRVVVVERGKVVQTGPPAQVARAPRTAYVAGLVGLNLYRGVVRDGRAALDDGGELQTAGAADGPALLTFAPTAVSLHRSRPEGSARNAWRGRVTGVEHHGASVRVAVDAEPPVLADVTTSAVAELDLVPGREVWASVKATEVHVDPVRP